MFTIVHDQKGIVNTCLLDYTVTYPQYIYKRRIIWKTHGVIQAFARYVMAEEKTTSYAHQHNYGTFQVKSEFRETPLKHPKDPERLLYIKTDFSYAMCNKCGFVLKKKLED